MVICTTNHERQKKMELVVFSKKQWLLAEMNHLLVHFVFSDAD